MMRTVLLYLSVFLLSSCANKNTTAPDNQPPLQGKYELVSVNGEGLSSDVLSFQFNTNKKMVFGYTGCNGFSSNYTQCGSSIVFTAPVSTRKYCQGKMQTEQEIQNALEATFRFSREGNKYIFYSETGNPLITLIKTDKR